MWTSAFQLFVFYCNEFRKTLIYCNAKIIGECLNTLFDRNVVNVVWMFHSSFSSVHLSIWSGNVNRQSLNGNLHHQNTIDFFSSIVFHFNIHFYGIFHANGHNQFTMKPRQWPKHDLIKTTSKKKYIPLITCS